MARATIGAARPSAVGTPPTVRALTGAGAGVASAMERALAVLARAPPPLATRAMEPLGAFALACDALPATRAARHRAGVLVAPLASPAGLAQTAVEARQEGAVTRTEAAASVRRHARAASCSAHLRAVVAREALHARTTARQTETVATAVTRRRELVAGGVNTQARRARVASAVAACPAQVALASAHAAHAGAHAPTVTGAAPWAGREELGEERPGRRTHRVDLDEQYEQAPYGTLLRGLQRPWHGGGCG